MKKLSIYVAAVLSVLTIVLITVFVENKKVERLEKKYISEIESGQAEMNSLNSELLDVIENRRNEKEILTELFHKVDYKDEPVYVIGHKSPDFDTTSSAIGMAYLLNEMGITAEARIAGPLNLETEYGLSVIGYPAPDVLENAADKQLWLVDHSEYEQMVDGADKARIVGITDHHSIGNVETPEPINVLSCPAGSTASLVYTLCMECDVEVSKDVAGVLLSGLLSDTVNMKSKEVTAIDEIAFASLKKISGISDTDALYNGMLEARLSYKGMNDREIFYSDYKEYETSGVTYGIGVVKVAHTDQVPGMAERMYSVIENEVKNGNGKHFLLFEVYDPDYSLGYMGFCGNDMEFTGKVMDTAFGGSGEKEGKFFVFSPSLSRKTDVVPPLDDCLSELMS